MDGRAPALDRAQDPGCRYGDPGGIREIEMVTETMSRRGAISTANLMALMCVADSKLGKFGEGGSPVTRTGEYSNVIVVDADGRAIPWQRVARLDADEMRTTMREIAQAVHLSAEPREHRAGGADRSSAPGHGGLGQTQRRCGPEEVDGGARQRGGRDRNETGRRGVRNSVDRALFKESETDAIDPSSALSSGLATRSPFSVNGARKVD